ncbi:MAG TPA: ATP-binding protein [Candidatus Limnocylindrales bacterium]|nr:ATP-binding protein [Candidatus Limnocylindrales bacterium]
MGRVTEDRQAATSIGALRPLHEITAHIVSTLDLDETLAIICRAMTQVLRADVGAIYLLDEEAQVLRLRGVHGQRSVAWAGHTMTLDQGLNARAVVTGQVQQVADYTTLLAKDRLSSPIVEEEPMRSVITAPMVHRGRRLGSMGAIRRRVDPFTPDELALLAILADHASIAVANALTYRELSDARARLQDAHRVGIRVHLEIGRHLQAGEDLPTFFGRLSQTIAELVGGSRAAFWLYDGATSLGIQREAFGFASTLLDRIRVTVDPASDGALERILLKDTAFRGVVGTQPDSSAYRKVLLAMQIRDAIIVPWTAGDERLGLLGVYDSTRPGGFVEEDLWVLRTAALAAGLIWQHRRAQDQLARQKESEAAHLRAVAERMAALEQAKSRFLNLASHELRGPVAVLRGYLSMLEDGSLGDLTPELHEVLPTLSAKAAQMSMLVGQMIDAARLEENRLELRLDETDLREVVQKAVRAVEPLAIPRSRITLTQPACPLLVLGDPGRLETIVANLLDNAVKYSPAGGDIACTVSTAGPWAQVEVRDHGIGIAAEDLPRLFTRFTRLETSETSHIPGTGLGLFLCQELARRHGGEITVASTPGQGSTFRLRVPLTRQAYAPSR